MCSSHCTGNHDNPDRLEAADPLANTHGVLLLGVLVVNQAWQLRRYRNPRAGDNYINICIRHEEAVIVTLPYPSEKRLNEIFSAGWDEEIRRQSYSQRIGEIMKRASKRFRDHTINLAVSHLYITGGRESGSERPIQLGGSYAVESSMLPNAQYIALGHLHRSQRVSGSQKRACYSGSPSSIAGARLKIAIVFIVDLVAGQEAQVEEVFLKNYKPIEIWKCKGIEEAMEKCRSNSGRNVWAYLEIQTDREITQQQMKDMKDLVTDIVQIYPKFYDVEGQDGADQEDYQEIAIDELFKAYYKSVYGSEIPEELLTLFYEIVEEGEEKDEAETAEDQGA